MGMSVMLTIYDILGSLAVTSTIRGGGRTTRWELRGDQKQDWHSAAVDLNMDGVQEVIR